MSFLTISGTWKGYFEYGQSHSKLRGVRKDFVLNLKGTNGEFFGECIDISEDYRNNLKAEIKGFINRNLISFIKRYPYYHFTNKDGKSEIDYNKNHPEIEYTGYYDEESNKFKGEWLMVTKNIFTKHDYSRIIPFYDRSSIDELSGSMKLKEYSVLGTWEIEKEHD